MMDAAIGDKSVITIYGNREFLREYRLAMGVVGSSKMYDGIPVVLRDQVDYFIIDITPNPAYNDRS